MNSFLHSILLHLEKLIQSAKVRISMVKQFPLLLPVLFSLIPLVSIAIFYEVTEHRHDRNFAFSHREETAERGALLVKERLDKAIDLSVSFTARSAVQQMIKEEDWSAAIDTMRDVPALFPYIETVTLLSSDGIVKASAPSHASLIGKDVSGTDHYREVTKRWSPTVSDVIQSAQHTEYIDRNHIHNEYNYLSVAIPIRADMDREVLGIVVLDIDIESFTDWDTDINAGPAGYMYIIDRKGVPALRLVEDSARVQAEMPILAEMTASFSRTYTSEWFSSAQNEALAVTIAKVPKYGVYVGAVQPTRVAFIEMRGEFSRRIFLWVLLILFMGVLIYSILRNCGTLRKNRDEKELFLESLGDGVIAIDRAWHIIFWNRAAATITGWQKNEVMGKPLRSFVKFIKDVGHTEDYSFIEDAIVSGNATSITKHISLIKKSGDEIAVGDSVSPIVSKQGETSGAIIIFRDVSKEIVDERLRSDFSYATHQLRTPVTEALWNLDLARGETDPKKKDGDLNIVHSALLSVKKLSEHLVEVSSVDQGVVVPHTSTVKILDIFTEVQRVLATAAKEKNITITLPPISAIETISTDATLCKRILLEVVENAIAYSPRGGTVEIKLSVQDRSLLVEISNTGAVIPIEEQPIIFTKFFRASNKGIQSAGAGLGLFIAKEYVSLLKGKLWFTSDEETGVTTFFILLPIA